MVAEAPHEGRGGILHSHLRCGLVSLETRAKCGLAVRGRLDESKVKRGDKRVSRGDFGLGSYVLLMAVVEQSFDHHPLARARPVERNVGGKDLDFARRRRRFLPGFSFRMSRHRPERRRRFRVWRGGLLLRRLLGRLRPVVLRWRGVGTQQVTARQNDRSGDDEEQ
ncbi:MAG: hypothetical protein DMG26_05310 [Acidobacteria bacterium]|nr:MAG: hypothetical protein DMG26_05310 [Acidobacteriota bacterium]